MSATSQPASGPVETAGETATGLGEAVSNYLRRVRGGEMGSLPAILGFVALFTFFAVVGPESFTSKLNIANLLNQSAIYIFIAMGLVFVLLLGEIDLSAGYTAGTTAAVLAVTLPKFGGWPASLMLTLLTAIIIGTIIGLLVAKLGIPSFVVTLAFFLALQGVMLLVIGDGGTIGVKDELIKRIMGSNLTPLQGWIFLAVIVGSYAWVTLRGVAQRRSAGLAVPSTTLVGLKLGALTVVGVLIIWFLNQERAVNPAIKSLKGVPLIVPILAAVAVALTILLSRTSFGRHMYAVGGNAEAARRAGINVARVRVTAFIICSSLAAFGGVVLASRDGSVSPSTGGSDILLYSVGAAVIGGTSLFGGRGRVVDAILGGLVVAVIGNGLPLITSEAGVQFFVTGAVLLLAASVDALSRKRASTS